MDPKPRWIDPRFALLTASVAVAIVYGSLFPFQYRSNGPPLRILLATSRIPVNPNEALANVLFYVPLGLAAVAALRRFPAWARVCLIGLGGIMLSACMELAQAYTVGRLPGLWDVYANTAGTLLGAGAGAIYSWAAAASFWGYVKHRPFVWLMLAGWLGYQLLVPSPLAPAGNISLLDLFQRCVVWLAVALLLEALVGAARSRVVLGCLTASVLAMQAMLAGFVLPPEQVWSGAIALLLWSVIVWRLPTRGAILAALFVMHVGLVALQPFHFLSTPRHFEMVPFISFLNDARDNGARSFLEKGFTYGTLVWLMVRAGWKLGRAAAVAGALVLVLRIGQIYLPGRSAEITDAMLTLALAGVMKLSGEDPGGDESQACGEATNRYPMPRTVSR